MKSATELEAAANAEMDKLGEPAESRFRKIYVVLAVTAYYQGVVASAQYLRSSLDNAASSAGKYVIEQVSPLVNRLGNNE